LSDTSRSSSPISASIPVRIAARVIDVVVLVAAGAAFGRAIGFGYDWLIMTASAVLVYFAAADTLAGATIGKATLGLRVIGPDGRRPSPRQAVVRESFMLLGAIPFVGPILALAVWAWIIASVRTSPLRQGKHDIMAGGTRVVRVESG
jgi:uncharacterized RDD family membrane protein YckC